MIRWTLQSNATDVLSLGPRTAGLLLRVGIRSVEQLLVAQPVEIEQRLQNERITAQTLGNWQREAQLILAAPQMPAEAVQILAVAGFSSPQKIACSAPTELLAAIDTRAKEINSAYSEENFSLPSVSVISTWIRSARESLDNHAA